MTASHKLSHLLQLADQGPALRAALAEEVAELLVRWPSDYPDSMKGVCEGVCWRRRRATWMPPPAPGCASSFTPIPNCRIACWALAKPPARRWSRPRVAGEALETALAENLGVDAVMAKQILDDESGAALAVACKGASLERATFSALMLLARPGRDRAHAFAALDAFDNVPASEATRVLRGWREGASAAA